MKMQLVAINAEEYINVGGGNITSVVDLSHKTKDPWYRINFISGSRVENEGDVHAVASILQERADSA